MSPLADACSQPWSAIERDRKQGSKRAASRVRDQIDRARISRREEHLRRFHRGGEQRRYRGRDRKSRCGRRVSSRQRKEKAERNIGDDIDGDVVARITCRQRLEQKKRRARQRCHPSGKRLQARIDDHYAIQNREILRKLRRVGAGPHPSILRTTVSISSSRSTENPWSRNKGNDP